MECEHIYISSFTKHFLICTVCSIYLVLCVSAAVCSIISEYQLAKNNHGASTEPWSVPVAVAAIFKNVLNIFKPEINFENSEKDRISHK